MMGFELIKTDDKNALPEEVAKELEKQSQENLEGVQPRLPKAQMPTGKGKIFTLEVPGGEERDTGKLRGIVLYQSPAKAYWSSAFGGGSAQVVPDCASHDGVKPANGYNDIQAQLCANCPHNQFGTATDDAGNKLPGKACRDVKRVVILLEDDPEIPYLLTVPPTGLRNFDDYLIRLRKEKRPYWTVLTEVTLTTDTNRTGIDYPKVVMGIGGFINDSKALAQIGEWRSQWNELLKATMFSNADVEPHTQDSGLGTKKEESYEPPPAEAEY
jgi:hypothetical protein